MCIVCLFLTPEFSRQWWNDIPDYITVQSNLKLKTILWHKQQDGNLSLSLFLLIKWQIKGRKNCLDRSFLSSPSACGRAELLRTEIGGRFYLEWNWPKSCALSNWKVVTKLEPAHLTERKGCNNKRWLEVFYASPPLWSQTPSRVPCALAQWGILDNFYNIAIRIFNFQIKWKYIPTPLFTRFLLMFGTFNRDFLDWQYA